MAKKRRRPTEESHDEPASKRKGANEENDRKSKVEDDIEEETEGTGAIEVYRQDEIIPFLDTFYGLSSNDPQERSVSAQAMLYHCLLGEEANTKDAAYAMKRLLNGLCSSRAASRQGYAAAFTSFLKLSFSLGTVKELQKELQQEGSLLGFIRLQVLNATDASKISGGGKKRAAEERDHQFGRLFGILSVVRSGILLPTEKDGDDLSEFVDNAVAYATSLVELHQVKALNEAVPNAIVTFLSEFYNHRNKGGCESVADALVKNAIIPKFLARDNGKNTLKLEEFTAEQLAVMLYIQSNSAHQLPSPLEKPILSLATIPKIAPALSSSAAAPGREAKLHQVWLSLFTLITEAAPEEFKSDKKRPKGLTRRILKEHIGADATSDVVNAVLQECILKPMSATTEEAESSSFKIEQHVALALSLLRILCGGEYVDTSSGRSFIDLDPSFLEEKILCPEVVKLLLDVIINSGKSSKTKKSSLDLKSVAIQTLESLVECAEIVSNTERRLACARALLRCEPRFDARTETSAISDLLMLDASSATAAVAFASAIPVWKEYISFLLQQIIVNAFERSKQMTENPLEPDGVASHKVLGFIDLLFGIGKQVLRMNEGSSAEETKSIIAFKTATIRRLLSFFLVAAFFKLESLKDPATETKKPKKKGKKSETANQTGLEEAASLLKRLRTSQEHVEFVPHSVRTVLSSRFFSLLSEYCTVSPSIAPNREQKSSRDEKAYSMLSEIIEGLKALESQGAVRYQTPEKEDVEREEGEQGDPMTMVVKLRSLAEVASESDETEKTKRRWRRSAALVAMVLSLHLLDPGSPEAAVDGSNEGFGADDDDEVEVEEVIGFMSDLDQTVTRLLMLPEQSELNPLLGLAELLVGILTSPIGNGTQHRGASSKLVREVVKLAWNSGLSLCADSVDSKTSCLLDQDVVNLLLASIGATLNGDVVSEPDEESNEDEEDEDEDEKQDFEDDDKDIAKSFQKKKTGVSDMEADVDSDDGEDSDDEDVVLDPSKLSSLLMEEGDDDMGEDVELEHHEGADAALAKFIKARQEARKAGQQARERLEMVNNLRNSMLLEGLVSNPNKAWDSLLKCDVILGTLLPLLRYRNDLEKSLASSADKSKNSSAANKKALVEKIGFLLKSKLCKMRLAASSIPFSDGVNAVDFISDVLGQLVKEAAKSQSREQLSCCSCAWIMILRSLADPLQAIQATQDHAQEAVRIWANQRNSGITANLLEDLIQQAPTVAGASLAGPLAKVAKSSRNFLKSEAIRLLSLLYGIPSQSPATAAGQKADDVSVITKPVAVGVHQLEEATLDVVEAILAMLEDDNTKAKRRRDVLKTLEKVVAWVATELNPCRADLASKLDQVANFLDKPEASGDSSTQHFEKLVQDIRAICSKAQSAKLDPGKGSAKKNKKSLSPKRSDEGSGKKKKKEKKDKKK